MDWDGKSIIITGASRGLGRELALRFSERKARVVLAARHRDTLEQVAEECRSRGGEPLVVPTDVSDREQCAHLIEETVRAFDGIDALINNAGINMIGRFDQVEDLSIFGRLVDVNYLGAVYCTSYALPHLKERKGIVVAVSSLAGLFGIPGISGYAASKHAMQGFFDSLRVELRGSGVHVLTVSISEMDTGVTRQALGPDDKPIGLDRSAQKGLPVSKVADDLLDAMGKRRRNIVFTISGKAGRWLRLIAPGVFDAFASRATEWLDRQKVVHEEP